MQWEKPLGPRLSMTTPEHPTAATMYCLGCGYCLDGLTEFRCPECGCTFNPYNKETFAIHEPDVGPRRPGFFLFIISASGAILICLHLMTQDSGIFVDFVPLAMLLEFLAIAFGSPMILFEEHKRSNYVRLALLIPVLLSSVTVALSCNRGCGWLLGRNFSLL